MRLPQKLSGTSPLANKLNEIIDCLQSLTPVRSHSSRVRHTPYGTIHSVDADGGGGADEGIHFDEKIEVDPTISYTRGTLLHIQSTHALVTTGYPLPSAPTGAVIKSKPGFWVSTQSVPAKALVGAVMCYNVPQFPLPVPTNLDDATNFWIYLGDIWCA